MNTQHQDPKLTAAVAAKEALKEQLLNHPDVSGVGVGGAIEGGAIALLVFLKKERNDLAQELKEFQGHPVEYMVSGPIVAYAKEWSSATFTRQGEAAE
jgi:hypothetical protein